MIARPGPVPRSRDLAPFAYLIQMDAAAPADWLPVVQRAIAAYGAVVPPASVLLPVIQGCDGSARDIVSSAVRVAIDVQRRAA